MAGLLRTNLQILRRVLTTPLTPKETTMRRRLATTPRYSDSAKGSTREPNKRKWVSYGFDSTDEAMDRHSMHQVMFVAVTITMVLGGTVLAYAPDPRGRDWAQREAYLQLRYREENGLPIIDPNLVDPAKITLPSDEELGNTEIII